MSPDEAIKEAQDGALRPLYVLLGPERHLASRVIEAIRTAAIAGRDLGLNEEHLVAGEVTAERVVSAARTLPMMAPRRFVLVRECDRWEAKGTEKAKTSKTATALDVLAAYAEDPTPSTALVLQATKLDARRRLVAAAKKGGYLVACETPPPKALPSWIARAAEQRGKRLAPGVGALLAELLGSDLATLDGAVEQLALYAGDDAVITEDAVGDCIVQVKPSTVWELVDAVGRRDRGAALTSLSKVYDPHDRGLRLLGVLAWSTRQLIRFASARREGLGSAEAAKRAGVPPFKAGQLEGQLRRVAPSELERWLEILASVDLDLKGGSRRPPRATLESALITLCGGSPTRRGPTIDRHRG